jgi:hypothetical protein
MKLTLLKSKPTSEFVWRRRDLAGADRGSNWLPTPPSGRFNLATRIYQHSKAVNIVLAYQ